MKIAWRVILFFKDFMAKLLWRLCGHLVPGFGLPCFLHKNSIQSTQLLPITEATYLFHCKSFTVEKFIQMEKLRRDF